MNGPPARLTQAVASTRSLPRAASSVAVAGERTAHSAAAASATGPHASPAAVLTGMGPPRSLTRPTVVGLLCRPRECGPDKAHRDASWRPAAQRQCHPPQAGRYDSGAMSDSRRARPTIRCLTEDLGLALPWLDTDLGEVEDPWLGELRRLAPVSPQGQKRVLSIGSPLVYRLRFSAERGVTWVDEDHGVVWLCAVHRRQEGSGDDAYAWFAKLHADGKLLPSGDDRLRDRAEAVIRLLNSLCDGRLGEARPARAGFELGVRAEQLIPAAGAAVGAIRPGVDVFAGEGGLGAAAAQHVVLLASQFMPPLLVRLLDLGRRGGRSGLGAAHR